MLEGFLKQMAKHPHLGLGHLPISESRRAQRLREAPPKVWGFQWQKPLLLRQRRCVEAILPNSPASGSRAEGHGGRT